MPYKKSSNYKGRKMKSRYFKKSSVSGNYRKSKPRTLQIATRRNPNQVLRFVVNQTYYLDGTAAAKGETAVLCFRANSIYNSHLPTSAIAGQWLSQDPTKYSNLIADNVVQSADGYSEWKDRYQHFCVLGSKIQSTFEPSTTGQASVHFHHLSGIVNTITKDTEMKDINKLPYIFRNSIMATTVQRGNTGSRMSQQYSAKKFEGVSNVNDNSNLRGSFATASSPQGSPPGEQSFFYVGVAPTTQKPATSPNQTPSGVVRIKIEYICMLKEPTESNQVQVTASASAHDEL
ncbi:MAG: putative capsid protein [Circoviridae sp.]|nr:MAG: putative capsid protein [Circoviridae sp.]